MNMTLREYLTLKKLRPSAFAVEIDVAPSTILRILKGERSPSMDVLQKINDGTDGMVTPNDFLSEGSTNEPEAA